MSDTDLFSSIGRPVRDVEYYSSFERPLLKAQRNRGLERVQLSQMEKEKKSVGTEMRLSDVQDELDRRKWRMQNADIALYETGIQLQSQRMELYLANQVSDQAQREKSWLCEELDMRNQAFQEDRARDIQEIEE